MRRQVWARCTAASRRRRCRGCSSRTWCGRAGRSGGVAETATKERGVDILAARDGRTLAVEVKGFPTRGTYADPARAGEVKPTQPGTQARHWYGQAILRAMLTHGEFPHYEVAIGLPDVPTYRRLHERTRVSLDRAAIGVLFVDEHGEVRS
ncbi:hypothetical protein [Parafrankia sp. FMc2]|uniref:hypothetical protein n=1 Tax=Parafrankia sp. FMc2 TaxID=3233196 RepID=UPI0034D7830E